MVRVKVRVVLFFAAAVFAAVGLAARAEHANTAERRFTEAALAQIAKFRSAEKAHVTTLAFATAADVTAAIRIASAPCGTLTFEYAALRSKAATQFEDKTLRFRLWNLLAVLVEFFPFE